MSLTTYKGWKEQENIFTIWTTTFKLFLQILHRSPDNKKCPFNIYFKIDLALANFTFRQKQLLLGAPRVFLALFAK